VSILPGFLAQVTNITRGRCLLLADASHSGLIYVHHQYFSVFFLISIVLQWQLSWWLLLNEYSSDDTTLLYKPSVAMQCILFQIIHTNIWKGTTLKLMINLYALYHDLVDKHVPRYFIVYTKLLLTIYIYTIIWLSLYVLSLHSLSPPKPAGLDTQTFRSLHA
jgi:hypothetical protein